MLQNLLQRVMMTFYFLHSYNPFIRSKHMCVLLLATIVDLISFGAKSLKDETTKHWIFIIMLLIFCLFVCFFFCNVKNC
jgi:hypothetical protein